MPMVSIECAEELHEFCPVERLAFARAEGLSVELLEATAPECACVCHSLERFHDPYDEGDDGPPWEWWWSE